MVDFEKITSDYKNALNEREQKLNELESDVNGLVYKKDVDEIQMDFEEDERTKEYHKLRREAKNNPQIQQDFMNSQKKIFNS